MESGHLRHLRSVWNLRTWRFSKWPCPVQSIVETLHDAGFSLSLAPAGGLAVSPASKLTPELRDIIRNGKADLIRWFSQPAANEPPADPSTWRELDKAYQLHHFRCSTCIAAGLGYGLRCGTGSALWTAYQNTNSI